MAGTAEHTGMLFLAGNERSCLFHLKQKQSTCKDSGHQEAKREEACGIFLHL